MTASSRLLALARTRDLRLLLLIGAAAAGVTYVLTGGIRPSYRATALVVFQQFVPDQVLLPQLGDSSPAVVESNELTSPYLPNGRADVRVIARTVAEHLPGYNTASVVSSISFGKPTEIKPSDIRRYEEDGLHILAVNGIAGTPESASSLANAFARATVNYRRRLLGRLIDLRTAELRRRHERASPDQELSHLVELRPMADSSAALGAAAVTPTKPVSPHVFRDVLLAGLTASLVFLLGSVLLSSQDQEHDISTGRPLRCDHDAADA